MGQALARSHHHFPSFWWDSAKACPTLRTLSCLPSQGQIHHESRLSTTRRPVYSTAGEAARQAIGRSPRGQRHRVCASCPSRHAAAPRGIGDVRRLLCPQTDQALAEGDPPHDRLLERCTRQRRANRISVRRDCRAGRQALRPRRRGRDGSLGTRTPADATESRQGPGPLASRGYFAGNAARDQENFCVNPHARNNTPKPPKPPPGPADTFFGG